MRLLVVGPLDVEAAWTLDGLMSKPAIRVSVSNGRRSSVGRCFTSGKTFFRFKAKRQSHGTCQRDEQASTGQERMLPGRSSSMDG